VEKANERGPNDLEEQIDMLTKQKEYMQKNVEKQEQLYLNKKLGMPHLRKNMIKFVKRETTFKQC